MNIALILQLVQFGAQFLQTSNALSPSATTSSLSGIVNAILGAQNQNPIKWIQGALNATVHSNLDVDGDFGPLTEGAIKQFLSSQAFNAQDSAALLAAAKILIAKL